LKAWRNEQPQLVICSPPCTQFSQLSHRNLYLNGKEWTEKFEADRRAAVAHIELCLVLMKAQMQRGRYLLLDMNMVKAARALEMDFFERMGVYTRVPKAAAFTGGVGKPIKGRWIGVNKGDSAEPDYRSRFVGKDSATGAPVAALLAATFPLEALKLLISTAAVRGKYSHIICCRT